MKASTTKTAGRMKATARVKAASGMKAAATMETAAHAAMEATTTSVETSAPTTMKTATSATAMARVGYVCDHEPNESAGEDPSDCQRTLLAAHGSQHVFLHLN